ncbi:Glutamine synthetase [Forsythia ovata]|uniref:Glutamine synthetase n=1 Tax=Forsythia ovata TaxID=205694 RepID=A0ABD1WR77_9LAMI
MDEKPVEHPSKLPKWNYDGSSTGQGDGCNPPTIIWWLSPMDLGGGCRQSDWDGDGEKFWSKPNKKEIQGDSMKSYDIEEARPIETYVLGVWVPFSLQAIKNHFGIDEDS